MRQVSRAATAQVQREQIEMPAQDSHSDLLVFLLLVPKWMEQACFLLLLGVSRRRRNRHCLVIMLLFGQHKARTFGYVTVVNSQHVSMRVGAMMIVALTF